MTQEQQEDKTILDKAKDLATDIKEKVTGYVGENEEKIHGAVDKTGEFIDDKTKGRFSEKIDKAQDAAKNAVTKIGGASGDDAGATDVADVADVAGVDPTPAAAPATAEDVPTPTPPTEDPDAPAPE
jgi:MT0933-like antitoxin protein